MFNAATSAQKLVKRANALRQRINAKNRIDLAHDIGATYCDASLSKNERQIAQEIVAKLIHDGISSVRAAISQAVATSPHLPRDLAEKLAQDIDEIAIPMLELSPVLNDKLLEAIIESGATDKMNAIARREIVSANLCRRIVATGRKTPVIQLLQNPGAKITNHTMVTIVRVYGDDELVEKAVLDRGELPDEVINNLCELTEAHVVSFVQRYFNLPEHVVNVQKGRNLLKTVKTTSQTTPTDDWWDTSKGAV
ncbi:MAG: DUF2336 domain-containing protein [Methylocystaceae bacterium]|nr:DUF2336 domain-containing protein [Methylocystaceae bacterium]